MSGTGLSSWPTADIGLSTAKSFRAGAIVVLGLLSAASAVVTARAMAGALSAALQPAVLLEVGVLTAAAAALVRLGWLLPLGMDRISRRDVIVMAAASFAAAGLCGGVSSPSGTRLEIGLLVWGVVALEEGWAWLWFFRKWERSASSSAADATQPSVQSREMPVSPPEESPAAEVTQQLTRSETAAGTEELSGWLRLPFAPGQRSRSAHVAFCPPLPGAPELEVEQIDGPEARIKTTQLLPYGVRFDLKLVTTAAEPAVVLLQFTARTRREP